MICPSNEFHTQAFERKRRRRTHTFYEPGTEATMVATNIRPEAHVNDVRGGDDGGGTHAAAHTGQQGGLHVRAVVNLEQ